MRSLYESILDTDDGIKKDIENKALPYDIINIINKYIPGPWNMLNSSGTVFCIDKNIPDNMKTWKVAQKTLQDIQDALENLHSQKYTKLINISLYTGLNVVFTELDRCRMNIELYNDDKMDKHQFKKNDDPVGSISISFAKGDLSAAAKKILNLTKFIPPKNIGVSIY